MPEDYEALRDPVEYEVPEKVGIVYSDVKRDYFASDQQYITERDANQDAQIVGRYLESMGVTVYLYPGDANLPDCLIRDKPNVVLNMVDSVNGDESRASIIPGVLELLDFPYTGAGILGLSLDSNKFLIKQLLRQHRIPIPPYQLFNTANDDLNANLRFPLISKLNAVHGSVEITQDAISENEVHLRKRISHLIQTYHQPVLVEEFIMGREITAILFEGLETDVFLAEKVFKDSHGKYAYLTFEDQWLTEQGSAFSYQRYHDTKLAKYVETAFSVTKMRGYGKFDIRLDPAGRYYFIDTNCNPAFGPKEMDVALSVILDLYDISFTEMLYQLLANTVQGKLTIGQSSRLVAAD